MISMSFYWALTVTQFFDNKRKDFWQMFIHHMITLLLMALSWVCNLHRVGSLVLVVHDCADIFLEVRSSHSLNATTNSIQKRNIFRLLKSQNMQNTKRFVIVYLPPSQLFGSLRDWVSIHVSSTVVPSKLLEFFQCFPLTTFSIVYSF